MDTLLDLLAPLVPVAHAVLGLFVAAFILVVLGVTVVPLWYAVKYRDPSFLICSFGGLFILAILIGLSAEVNAQTARDSVTISRAEYADCGAAFAEAVHLRSRVAIADTALADASARFRAISDSMAALRSYHREETLLIQAERAACDRALTAEAAARQDAERALRRHRLTRWAERSAWAGAMGFLAALALRR